MMDASARKPGQLYIVATPIGHQKDVTLRALEVFASVDAILAEDTRHTLPWLTSLGIQKPIYSLHAHNEENKSKEVILALQKGQSFALISDAGTPLISDPGYLLVKHAKEQNLEVIPIPGACALIAALSAAGIPSDTFTFYGFLPAKTSARQEKLRSVSTTPHTLIFYESTHRILDSLDDIALVFGSQCPLVLAKEITKQFERIMTSTCAEILAWLRADPLHCKGEFVLMIPPRDNIEKAEDSIMMLALLLKELPLKQAVKLTSQLTKVPKNLLYQKALTLSKGGFFDEHSSD